MLREKIKLKEKMSKCTFVIQYDKKDALVYGKSDTILRTIIILAGSCRTRLLSHVPVHEKCWPKKDVF